MRRSHALPRPALLPALLAAAVAACSDPAPPPQPQAPAAQQAPAPAPAPTPPAATGIGTGVSDTGIDLATVMTQFPDAETAPTDPAA